MGISVKVLVQPTGEPLTLAEAKLAAQVSADLTSEDDYLANLVTTARQYCEDTLGQALISQTVLVTWDRFPRYSQQGGLQYQSEGLWDQRIPVTEMAARYWPDRATFRFPRSPLQNVLSIQYTDITNTLQTLATNLYRVDYTSEPGRIAPSYGNIWPLIVQQTQAVSCQAVVGYGPSTTIAASISAGQQTVTPASMYGIYAQQLTTDPIYPGTVLAIDSGQNRELVTVTAATASTFTATFAKAHGTNTIVLGGIPETIRSRMKMLIAHWFRNREAVAPGQYGSLPLAAEAFHWAAWNGEYN